MGYYTVTITIEDEDLLPNTGETLPVAVMKDYLNEWAFGLPSVADYPARLYREQEEYGQATPDIEKEPVFIESFRVGVTYSAGKNRRG